MKLIAVAAFMVLVSPSVAHAEATIAARDVPLHGARALADAVPRFNMVGLHWRGAGTVQFRTRSLAGRWSAWHPAAPEAEDGPDHPGRTGWRIGNPYWTGAADAIAYRLRGAVTRLRVYFVWSPVDSLPPRRLSIAGSPPIITRLSWGADESIRRAPPQYAPALQYALVHHTAGTNNYSPADSAAIVRGIEIYHVKGNGWNDIGYNFLVDKHGQIFEGRYGGVDQPVIGAHAQGFNTGSVGVAVLGTYNSAAPPAAAQTALANLLAWRLDIAHVDPLSSLTALSGGNARFPVGTPVFLRAISGHRDTGFTDCPGNALYARLGAIAHQVAAIGLPKLYAPSVQGEPGRAVTFRARLSTPEPWTVTVTDATGAVIAIGSGVGTDLNWTWNAVGVPQARYGWTISAGPDVRSATGFVGAVAVPLALKSASVKPATIDGTSTRTTLAYSLTTAAQVTAVLRTSDGRQLSTLFQQQLRAGKHSFSFSADNVADGRYTIVLNATDGKTTVSATLPLVVDRTLSRFTVAPAVFSPNGDGRDDTVAFTFHLARPAQVRLDVKRGKQVVDTVANATDQTGDQTLGWDGATARGRIPDGSYSAVATATSPIGTTTHSLPLRVDTGPPRLRAISFRRLVFRISEPARVTLIVNGRAYVRNVRAGVFSAHVVRVVRRVVASAEDAAGNISRTLRFP
jgi:N-acetylmuramoyl-L-alanine amidase/FlgD Ig-like domain